MKPTVGHFAKVMNEGEVVTAIIDELTYFNDKLVEVRCCFTKTRDHKGFYPDQILEVIENPDAEKYVAALKKNDIYRYFKTQNPNGGNTNEIFGWLLE